MSWQFPLNDYDGAIPEGNHLGAFGATRKYHCHEGIDLYCSEGSKVYAVEDGTVVFVDWFTGAMVNSSWWNDTYAVMVEGKSGVVLYGEIFPDVKLGEIITKGQDIGRVITVLKKDKGRPMSMLHLELYTMGTREPVEWLPNTDKPINLCNPTKYLLEAK